MVRVERLGEPAQELLRLLAAGRRVSHGVLAEASGLEPAELRGALREAAESHLVEADEQDRYRFRHALLREVIHDDLLPGEHAELHLALARVLEQQRRREPGRPVPQRRARASLPVRGRSARGARGRGPRCARGRGGARARRGRAAARARAGHLGSRSGRRAARGGDAGRSCSAGSGTTCRPTTRTRARRRRSSVRSTRPTRSPIRMRQRASSSASRWSSGGSVRGPNRERRSIWRSRCSRTTTAPSARGSWPATPRS